MQTETNTPRPTVKVWVSKYALTKGISEHDAEIVSDRMCAVGDRYRSYYHKGEWHMTEAEAVARAELMRKSKLVALQKAIARLKQLKF